MILYKCISRFIQSLRLDRNLSKNTLKSYLSDLDIFAKWLEESEKLQVGQISTEKIRFYIEYMQKQKGYESTTVRRRLVVLRLFFGYLEDEEIIFKSPMRKIRNRYKIKRKLPEILSYKEVKWLLEVPQKEYLHLMRKIASEKCLNKKINYQVIKAIRGRAILEILFATGIRVSELVGLDLKDLYINEGTILVRGKGGKERIIFFCSNKTKKAMNDYIRVRKKIANNTQAFFLNKFGKRLSSTSVEKMFQKYCEMTKIKKKVTPHTLRHTLATMLLDSGADLRVVQEILGHVSIATTQIYTYVSTKRQRQIMMKYNPRDRISV